MVGISALKTDTLIFQLETNMTGIIIVTGIVLIAYSINIGNKMK